MRGECHCWYIMCTLEWYFFRIRTVKTKKNEFFFTQNESLMMTVVSCH